MPKTLNKSRHNILRLAAPLFAQSGFDGVSMRTIAAKINLTPAALYYHFKNKEALYLETIHFTFGRQTRSVKRLLDNEAEPLKNLEAFIDWFVQTLRQEKDFQKLIQWVLLDNDPARMHSLVKGTFEELFMATKRVADLFKPRYDPHMLSISIIGLVLCHFESQKSRESISGNKASHDHPKVISEHIVRLLKNGLLPAC